MAGTVLTLVALRLSRQVFHRSGIVATLCTGLIPGALARRGQLQAGRFAGAFWRLAAWTPMR